MEQVFINKIIPFSCVDGFGNRTSIFLQGCNQDCQYCHNPETIHMCTGCGACVSVCPEKALTLSDGRVIYDPKKCCGCDTCLHTCPNDASPKTQRMDAEMVFKQIEPYFPFINGITTSGGECTLYPDFLTELYQMVKAAGKTTYMDTNGQVPLWDFPELLEVTDQTMIDLKAGTNKDHIRLTGRSHELPAENIRQMANLGKLYEIRTVIVPDVVDNLKTVELGSQLITGYPNVRYKLIKFRHYGVRTPFLKIPEPSDEMMEALGQAAKNMGVKEVLIV